MSTILAFALLLTVTLILLLLPFLPGCLVLWRKQDATPLRVVRSDDVDARFFARRFRSYIRENLEPQMRESHTVDTDSGLLICHGDAPVFSDQELQDREISRMLISNANLHLPGDLIFRNEVFAARSIHGGDRNIYRALLADGEIVLGAESMLLRWMHASGDVRIGADALLHGRVTSDSIIMLESGCRFERLHAPRIEFGATPIARATEKSRTPLEPDEVPHVAAVTGRRWLIDFKSNIPADRIIHADMVFTGEAWIGAGTQIHGSIKGHKDVFLGDGVRVLGSIVSIRDIYIGAGCVVHGPVLSERSVNVGAGSIIGASDTPTTVSARDIYVAPGVVAHGTVWTRLNGQVSKDAKS